MGSRRGQISAEYLSNYTIAAVVIVIVLAAFTYFGVWDMILHNEPPICIFQKGVGCTSHYIQRGNPMIKLNLYNDMSDAIVISGVICSAEPINPATALPMKSDGTARDWNDPSTNRPTINGIPLPQTFPENNPVIRSTEAFEVSVYCFTEGSASITTLNPQDRYRGLVFIQYRMNSSPNIPGSSFVHTLQGNLQGRPN